MKALLYKDLWVCRRTTLTALLLGVALCVIPFPFDPFPMLLIYGSMLLPQLVHQEHQDHWYPLATMLPYSPRALVGGKYLLAGSVAAILGAASFFGQLVTCPGASAAEHLHAAGCIVGPLLVVYAIFLPALFHLGPDSATAAYIIAFGSTCCAGAIAALTGLSEALLPQHLSLFLLLALLLFLASFPVAVKRYEKRLW